MLMQLFWTKAVVWYLEPTDRIWCYRQSLEETMPEV